MINQLMLDYINRRVQDAALPIFCDELARLDQYQRSYRRARGFPEEPPDPRRDTIKFHFGLLSDMPTIELQTQRTEPIKIKTKTRALQF